MTDREAQDEWDIARKNSIGNEKTIGEILQEKIDKLEKERNQYKEKAREFENKYIEVTNLYLNSIPKKELEKLKVDLKREYETANESFMKKKIPTSIVDGTIMQELGWIINEIDRILGKEE